VVARLRQSASFVVNFVFSTFLIPYPGQTMDENSLPRKILVGELHYAKLWLVCVALRGVSWDKMPFEQRELAFQAKDAAFNCLSIFLNSAEYRWVSVLIVSRCFA
jgi:hypothetical protein